LIFDAPSGNAGFVEKKAAADATATVIGGGFKAGEVITLIASNNTGAFVVLAPQPAGAITANAAGAFQVNVRIAVATSTTLTPAGSPFTVRANGDQGTTAYGVFGLVDKVTND
jgi:hypothetical protein